MGRGLILAIDQSTSISGWAILDANRNLIDYGIWDKTNVGDTTELGHTIKRNSLKKDIIKTLQKYPNIIQVICEGVTYQRNPQTHMKLSKCQGLIENICYELKVNCLTFNASSWRSYLPIKFGKKRNEIKENTKKYILSLYPEIGEQEQDVYDAIGIGLAYLNMVIDIGQVK